MVLHERWPLRRRLGSEGVRTPGPPRDAALDAPPSSSAGIRRFFGAQPHHDHDQLDDDPLALASIPLPQPRG
eukprot:1994568-Rhodomonas_salina.1